MNKSKPNLVIKILVVVSYFIMIITNALANIIPLNGVTTGEVSEKYENLFTPASITFSIWFVIYLLLGAYVFYQLLSKEKYRFNQIGIYFIISSIANALWIITWHYDLIPITMILMIIILFCLIFCMKIIVKEQLSLKEQLLIRLPFSVYFGWINIATFANATVLLVSLNWNGFGLSESNWTVCLILHGVMIGLITLLKLRDISYGLVFIWAYLGILFKHISINGFACQYPNVIVAVIVSLVLLIMAETYILLTDKRKNI